MRVLVTAASRHGATREIAAAIGRALGRAGLDADVRPIESLDGPGVFDGYDAAVIGSAVYYGHWLEPARELASLNAVALEHLPVWLFSSGPVGTAAGGQLPAGDHVDVAALVQSTRALDHRVFGGKLDRAQLGFRERAVVAALRGTDGDARDWAAIDAFADEIAARLLAGEGAGEQPV